MYFPSNPKAPSAGSFFAEPVPREQLPQWTASLYTLSFLSREEKLRRCGAMIDLAKEPYRIVTTSELLEKHRAYLLQREEGVPRRSVQVHKR